jgi:hypothetical protein
MSGKVQVVCGSLFGWRSRKTPRSNRICRANDSGLASCMVTRYSGNRREPKPISLFHGKATKVRYQNGHSGILCERERPSRLRSPCGGPHVPCQPPWVTQCTLPKAPQPTMATHMPRCLVNTPGKTALLRHAFWDSGAGMESLGKLEDGAQSGKRSGILDFYPCKRQVHALQCMWGHLLIVAVSRLPRV